MFVPRVVSRAATQRCTASLTSRISALQLACTCGASDCDCIHVVVFKPAAVLVFAGRFQVIYLQPFGSRGANQKKKKYHPVLTTRY